MSARIPVASLLILVAASNLQLANEAVDVVGIEAVSEVMPQAVVIAQAPVSESFLHAYNCI
ncbi:MAG: hypothetical protein A2133_05375 [Actinobacteria bacterium RBG_16_64_13]|nr:MAG: hypothetical protein A2133_05375 [Actinobacteria bacterium RBG_16_64_13]